MTKLEIILAIMLFIGLCVVIAARSAECSTGSCSLVACLNASSCGPKCICVRDFPEWGFCTSTE